MSGISDSDINNRRNDLSHFLIKEKSPNLTIRGVSSVSTFKLFTCLKLTLTYRLHLVKHFRVTCPITTNFGSGFMVSNLQTHPPVLNFKGGPSTNGVKKQSHVSHKSVSILPHSPKGAGRRRILREFILSYILVSVKKIIPSFSGKVIMIKTSFLMSARIVAGFAITFCLKENCSHRFGASNFLNI